MPPSAREAAAILRQHFGFGVRPDDTSSGVGDPTGSVLLGGLRTDRQKEQEDQLDTALRVGDRGEALYRGSQLGRTNREIADDPFTGDKETARIGGIQDTLDSAATTMRPEVADAAETVAKRNAFADFLKTRGHAMGEFEAAGSPEALRAAQVPFQAKAGQAAQDAADADLARQQKLRMSPQLVPGQMPTGGDAGDGTGSESGFSQPPNMKPLGAEGERAMVSMRENAPLLGKLQSLLNPNRSEVPNVVANNAKWAAYKVGLSDTPFLSSEDPVENAKQQARLQLASMITIIGSTPFLQGSRNYQRIKDIEKHLTNPTASDKFLWNQVNSLRELLPVMQHEIMQAHRDPSAPLNFNALTSGELPVTDPNRGR